jgi:deoxyribose-phosphate aldolase
VNEAPRSPYPADPELDGNALTPNRGVPLDEQWIQSVRANTSAVERRAATLSSRRAIKKEWQIAWLLKAVSCMDLTTLSGDDTEDRVRRLCAKGVQPIELQIKQQLGVAALPVQVAAICVYQLFVEVALRALEGTGVRVAAVSTGFPAGLNGF